LIKNITTIRKVKNEKELDFLASLFAAIGFAPATPRVPRPSVTAPPPPPPPHDP